MDNLLTRHRNVSILVAVLFAQILGLAVQVKRASSGEETRLIRVWAVEMVTPFEKGLAWIENTSSNVFHNYIYLRGVRAENRQLKQQIEEMRLQQVRLAEDAEQARRLQLLLGFKEKFVQKTVPAQVIGTSGTDQSRSVYIDKGRADGIKPDQAVITADGIVGKILHVYDDHTANLLLVNDQSSGVGVILENSRLQGILRGAASGQLLVDKIMNDESVQPGERVLTSGGDQIFPKGLAVGAVAAVTPGKDFLEIRVKPAANLSKLEEVLVITQVENRSPSLETAGAVRAIDVLTQRLPSVPEKPPVEQSTKTGAQAGTQSAGTTAKPAGAPVTTQPKAAEVVSTQKALTSAGTAGVAKPPSSDGSATPAKPVNVPGANATQSPKPVSGTENRTGTAGATTASPKPADVKPTSGSASGTTAVKPTLVQGANSKPAAPASTAVDKSAAPAATSKPQAVPVEDKPQ